MVLKDRRKSSRHEIQNAVSVSDEGIFQLRDISQGGLCFKCPPNTAIPDAWSADIINSISSLEEFPLVKIWISVHDGYSLNKPSIVFVGAKFDKLLDEKKAKLELLLKSISNGR